MKIFENTGEIDFPFYNGIPELSKLDWTVLATGPILTLLTILLIPIYQDKKFIYCTCTD